MTDCSNGARATLLAIEHIAIVTAKVKFAERFTKGVY